MSRAQGSLEYVIIIGGIIILAAATYFMLKGFSQTTGAGTMEQVGVTGEKLRLELENLGRQETKFSAKKWGSFPYHSSVTINNTGTPDSVQFSFFNLTDYGLNLSEIEFAYNDSGEIITLDSETTPPGDPTPSVNVTYDNVPSGESKLILFHNNSSALELDYLNLTSDNSNINITDDGGTSPVPSPDQTPPSASIPTQVEGELDIIEFEIPISGSGSAVSEVYYEINDGPWLPADNFYYQHSGVTSIAYPTDGSYDSENENITLVLGVPSEGNYTLMINVTDEYSNEHVETQVVEILTEIPLDSTPPTILSTQPANNTLVTDSLLTINVTTDETAECRFSISPGTTFSSMNPFNQTNASFHQIEDLPLSGGVNYKYYFKCNDTYGNVNTTDHVLNFTKMEGNPPEILGTEPANNSYVTDSPLTINITTNEIAHCRFSNTSGTPYPSMTDFNNTDSTLHSITSISLSDGQVYEHYFRCNDTAGNVNMDDYLLNFTADLSPPVISNPQPANNSIVSLSPIDINISTNEIAHCRFSNTSGTPYSSMTDFNNTDSLQHDITNVPLGYDQNYEYYLKCQDSWGNTNLEDYLMNFSTAPGSWSWGPEVQLSNSSEEAKEPAIAASGNNVHAVWNEGNAIMSVNNELYYKNSSDGGTTWSSMYNLTPDDDYDSDDAAIAVNGDYIHVVWTDERDGNGEIYYKNSTDGGITWSSDYRLTNAADVSRTPKIGVNGNIIHVVWEDRRSGIDIYYKNSTDGGITWSSDYALVSGSSSFPDISVDGNTLHVVWAWYGSYPDYRIYYKNSTDGGITWSSSYQISTGTDTHSEYPAIDAGGSQIHIVWTYGSSNYKTYYRNSSDGGITWGPDTQITNGPSASVNPDIAVSGNEIHVVDRGYTGSYRPHYKNSTDGGITWIPDYQLTSYIGDGTPGVAIGNDDVHIAWADSRDDGEVIYRKYEYSWT